MADFTKTERTRMRRKAKRATYDRETIYAILDEALIASVAVSIKGQPNVQPMIHRRLGDRLILHGLATNRLLNAIAEGAEACINVFHLDALAIARKIEDHSMLYRSATIYGRGELVGDEAEKLAIMGQVFASLVGSGRLATLPPLQARLSRRDDGRRGTDRRGGRQGERPGRYRRRPRRNLVGAGAR